MIDNDAAVEAMIQEKGLTAPRILPSMIEAMVNSLTFKVHHFEGTTTMVAMASLPSGFEVGIGKSACASPENFNAEVGEKIATDNARDAARANLWQFEGYVLKKQLSAPVLNFKERVIDELEQLTAKVNALAKFITTPLFAGLDRAEKIRLEDQYGAMMTYAQILVRRIEAFEVQHHPV